MKRSNLRLRFLYVLMLTVIIAVIINVFFVTLGKTHIRSHTSLVNYVQSVANVEEKIFASRGNIYDASGSVIAQDMETYDIICFLDEERLASNGKPAYVDNPAYAARVLSDILEMNSDDIYDILTSNPDLYQVELGVYGRNLSKQQKEAIEAIEDLHGIGFRKSYLRYYPYGSAISPQLVGFARSDNTGKLIGQLGIEAYLDDELSGYDGYHSYQMDVHGYILPGMYEETKEAINGYDVYLTLDVDIQEALNEAIQTTIEAKEASRAWGSVVEIKTGKILAWAQTPSYDPNDIRSDDVQVNYGSQLAYEPGSVMKSVIYAAAMDMGVYDGDKGFDSSPYCYTASRGRTYNTAAALGCVYNVSKLDWGTIPLDYGLIYSSNVATATLLAEYVGAGSYEDYLKRFHLYERVNSDGIDEIAGFTNYGRSPIDDISATYGQGSSTTMLQLLQAYTAIFGNGEMVKPYLIDKIVDPNTDTVVYHGTRNVVSEPISKDTAKKMQDLLRRVVSEPDGTCRHYAASTVEVMGKTGTSEISEDGGYAEDLNIISCMLGFPYEDPQYMLYYAYVSPMTVYYNYDIKPVPDLIDKIALITGLNKTENDNAEKHLNKYSMPDLLSNKTAEAIEKLNDYEFAVSMIGDGNYIIDQYPKADSIVYTNQKVFLLTDGVEIILPDFSGWTRKEVINYWQLAGLSIRLEGYGVAYEQDPTGGNVVDSSSEITIRFRDIRYVEKEEEPQADEDIEESGV